MSVTRQQRRQQLLNELESVRHLLQEPSDEAATSIAADSIPVLSEIMPINTTDNSKPDTRAAEFTANNAGEPASQVTTPQIQTQLDATAAEADALQTSNAMQQLIAKLTQRQPANSAKTPSSETIETVENNEAIAISEANEHSDLAIAPLNAPVSTSTDHTAPISNSANPASPATMLFNAVSSSSSLTINHAPPSLPLLFQAVTETPVFAAPTFTELELRQPQFDHQTPVATDTIEATTSDQPTSLLSNDDIEQLLFDIMPAVEELLRERLRAILLKR